MISSPIFLPTGTQRAAADRSEPVCTPRERTNGAPCLGLMIAAAGAVWLGLGSTLALLIL